MKLRDYEEFILWRRRLGWTQQMAANHIRVTQGYVSQWEKGVRPVPDYAMAEVPKNIKATDGEELLLRIWRADMNMASFAKSVPMNFYMLLKMVRDERHVTKQVWAGLTEVENG